MRMKLIGAVIVALALALTPWVVPAQAGPAYEKSGKYDDYPTYEGRVVTVNLDGGRLSLRGDGGFKTFSAPPATLKSLEKDAIVRVTYQRDGSGSRAVRIVPVVVPEGATPEKDIAEAKEKMIEKAIRDDIAEARKQ